jgi:hypothetical protein
MSFEKFAEDAGRKFAKTDAAEFLRKVTAGRPSKGVLTWGMTFIVVLAGFASIGTFLWMYRYQVVGGGLILDRFKQVTYHCDFYNSQPICNQLFPPRPGGVPDL